MPSRRSRWQRSGGLVANAVIGLINVPAFRHLARVRRSEFVIALICAGGVLVLGPLPGLSLAAIASAVDVVRRAADLPWTQLDAAPDPAGSGRFARVGDRPAPDGLRILRPEGPLFFANATTVRDRLGQAARDPDARWVVLDLEAVSDIDPTAAEALTDAIAGLHDTGTVLALSRVRHPVRSLLERYGLDEGLDESLVFRTNRAAAVAFQTAMDQQVGESPTRDDTQDPGRQGGDATC